MSEEARRLRGDLALAHNAVRLLVAENQRLRARLDVIEVEVARLRAGDGGAGEAIDSVNGGANDGGSKNAGSAPVWRAVRHPCDAPSR